MGPDRAEFERRKREWSARAEAAHLSGAISEQADALRQLAELERCDATSRADALRHYEEAIDILRSLGDPLRLSHAVRHYGQVHEDDGRLEHAEAAYDEALAICRENWVRASALERANALRYSAAVKERLAKPQGSLSLWLEARELYREAGVHEGVAEANGAIARISDSLGLPPPA